jgi:DNA-binding GntR family transcriptional regulator
MSQALRLREMIEEEILDGTLAPGSRLDETAVAARFGVSRTPVREALQQLGASGMLDLRPRRGAVVAALGPDSLIEMFEVMAELEAMAARLAARRLLPDDRETIARCHSACGAAVGDSDGYYHENELFHRAIYRASGNHFLAAQCETLQKRLAPYRRLQLRHRNRVPVSYAEHEAIVSAINDGRADDAAYLQRNHVTVQGERFTDLIAGLRTLSPK